MRVIQPMEEKYRMPSLELVEKVFTAHENAEEGKLVRRLVKELVSGGLEGIRGQVEYSAYRTLCEE